MRKSDIIAAVERYTGKHILPHNIETADDPIVRGVVAIRWQRTRKNVVDLLLTPEGIEEVEFAQWPPRSHA